VSRLREFYRPRLDADLAGIVDLNRLVEQSIKLSQPKWKDQALSNGIAIEIKTELDSVSPVAGHESELREVLTNLVFNAVDAMPKSGSITLRTKADGDHVRLEVSDTGTGMTEDVRRRCLEPFFSTKGEKGSGLGLAMVYGIIKRLRGTIEITSALGAGTTFSIRLPIQAEPAASARQEGQGLEGVRLQILVVDDDPLVGRVTGEYLRVAGHRVDVVTSAAEAVKRFNPERVHLVVTDHGMPNMTGRQLAEVIKQVSPETPVVLLTGGDEIDAKETASSAVDAELSKPLTMAALQRTLSTLTFPAAIRAESGKEIGDAA
jgi:CheY-like chemotaxis protein